MGSKKMTAEELAKITQERERELEKRARRWLWGAGVCFVVFCLLGGMCSVYMGIEDKIMIAGIAAITGVSAALVVLGMCVIGLPDIRYCNSNQNGWIDGPRMINWYTRGYVRRSMRNFFR